MPIKQWERQYAFLNDTQLQDPVWVIYACATGDTVFNDRTHLFDFFYAALQSKRLEYQEAEMMAKYMFCWERMIRMIEACHRVAELKTDKQFHYSYSGDLTPK
jgi:hypothetical protein